jgi:hypothetical protein
MSDIYFTNNKFIGPFTMTLQCGRGGKGSKTINTLDLSDQSQQLIIVECLHGQREVRWNRRHQLCKKCAIDAGVYNTSPKGRIITWGDKISQAKKGINFTNNHKKKLVEIRKVKFCERSGISLSDFTTFPSYSNGRWNVSYIIRQGIIYNWDISKIEFDETFNTIFNILGYDLLILKNHLESKFLSGMSWSNYGFKTWHIDHIKPLSWFDIKEIGDQSFKDCWQLSNLQPSWAIDNFKKSNHFIG